MCKKKSFFKLKFLLRVNLDYLLFKNSVLKIHIKKVEYRVSSRIRRGDLSTMSIL